MNDLDIHTVSETGEVTSSGAKLLDSYKMWNSIVIDNNNRLCVVSDHALYLMNAFGIEYTAEAIKNHPEARNVIFIDIVSSAKSIYYASSRMFKEQYATIELLAIHLEYKLYRVNTWYWHITRANNPNLSETEFIELIQREHPEGTTVTRLMYSPPSHS